MNTESMLGVIVAACLAAGADAASIYMMSSGDPVTDDAAASALTSRGHAVTIGDEYWLFDGTASLADFDTVYLQANYNWTAGNMPISGQDALVAWVHGGGRLVTSEWVIYYTAPTYKFDVLAEVIPIEQSFNYGTNPLASYQLVTSDPAIGAGVPALFEFPLTSYGGTETFSAARPGATTYYETLNAPGAPGLTGWARGEGHVYSFSSTCGPDQVSDPEFGGLFSNVMGPADGVCYADCDDSGALDFFDFLCFQNAFAAGEPYADCDDSGAHDFFDFLCFQNAFAAGCP